MEEIGQCDICGFIFVDDLQWLFELDVFICVFLCNDFFEFFVLYWKLVFQCVVVGIGCCCDMLFFLLVILLVCQFEVQKFDLLVLKVIGSVMFKKGELGFIQFVFCCCVFFKIFIVEVLCEFEYYFFGFGFVRKMVGVGSVFGLVVWLLSQG